LCFVLLLKMPNVLPVGKRSSPAPFIGLAPPLVKEGDSTMKMLISPTLAVSALASPALSFAQASTAPATRAQVDADLVRIEQAGYMPSLRDDVHYPADVQMAEAKVAAQSGDRLADKEVGGTPDRSGMGAEMSGSSNSGARVAMFAGPSHKPCVGPVSFCNAYFGS
jgi:hypothetical protein